MRVIKGGLNGGMDSPCNKEREKEPVRVPVVEIIIVTIAVIALILLLFALWEIIIAAGAALEPVMAAVIAIFGFGAAPALAASSLPGDGLLPPGDCDKIQWRTLQTAVGVACKSKPFSCVNFPDKGSNCAELTARRNQALACAAARTTINTTCIRGGDKVHTGLAAGAAASAATCECKLVSNGCPP
ncbi:hypothetical protein [Vitiosangium sp. GDMCC 1.1324]|uniref:hypothetical protein n=1 Tax=Vitiosangium sp. (strain GDMCC 1.1324) TaxID=2138576 RepID=UPI00130EA749|nr:hypothetical protein [Vitiosangium sp. GDMCC 1.1324]